MKEYLEKLKAYVETHPIQFDEDCDFLPGVPMHSISLLHVCPYYSCAPAQSL